LLEENCALNHLLFFHITEVLEIQDMTVSTLRYCSNCTVLAAFALVRRRLPPQEEVCSASKSEGRLRRGNEGWD